MRAARRSCWAAILAHGRAWLVAPRPDLATLGRLLGLMQRTRSRVEGDKGTECGAPAVKVLTSYFGRCVRSRLAELPCARRCGGPKCARS